MTFLSKFSFEKMVITLRFRFKRHKYKRVTSFFAVNPKSLEKNPETFTVLGLLSVTINEILTVAGYTLIYGKRASVDYISD